MERNVHNPMSFKPGQYIQIRLEELGVTKSEAAKAMHICRTTLSRLLNGKIAVTPEMAIRLSLYLGESPYIWMSLQVQEEVRDFQQGDNREDLRQIIPHRDRLRISRTGGLEL